MSRNILSACRRWSENERVLCLVMVATLVASFYRGYGFSNNSYAIASWLVTYENGFIKRGLIGTLLQLEQVSSWTGISVPNLFFGLTNGLLVALHLLVLLVLLRMIRLEKAMLLFLPYFLAGPFLRVQSVWIGNIDHLLGVLMIAVVYSLVKRRIFLAGLIAGTGIFIHEIIFAMIFPVFIFFLWLKACRHQMDSREFREALLALLTCTLIVLSIIFYQDQILSDRQIAQYIDGMIARQSEDNYNRSSITEVYATPFHTWFLSQKDLFISRVTNNGLFLVIIFPALAFLLTCYLLTGQKSPNGRTLTGAFLLLLTPLGVLAIAWDIDRIWNLSTWVLFLMLWLWLEEDHHDFEHPRYSALVILFLSVPALLIPQVRGNISWGLCLMIYIPLILWQLVYLIGRFDDPTAIYRP